MGIKTKSLDHYIINLTVPGTATTGLHKAAARVPFTGWLANLIATAAAPGTGVTATAIDVNKNDVSIYSSSGISIAATTGVVTYGALTADPTPVTAGDILSIDVDAIAVACINTAVQVVVSKRPPAATDHQANLDNVL